MSTKKGAGKNPDPILATNEKAREEDKVSGSQDHMSGWSASQVEKVHSARMDGLTATLDRAFMDLDGFYMLLRLDSDQPDEFYARACRRAARVFISAIAERYIALAADLREKLDKLEEKPLPDEVPDRWVNMSRHTSEIPPWFRDVGTDEEVDDLRLKLINLLDGPADVREFSTREVVKLYNAYQELKNKKEEL